MANSSKNQPKTIGVIGAGTMGAGIALTALFAGHDVVLQDTFPKSLESAQAYIEKFLKKKDLSDRLNSIRFTEKLEDLGKAIIVIEAAPENLELKQDLFRKLENVCPPTAILATNTSTLSVTAIAAATEYPARVAGLHFFNPAPVLPLIEVVRAAQTNQATVDELITLAKSWGKTPVLTGDTPGFIVNRVARPFYGEALRLLGEGVAMHAQIDTIVEQGAGFRMGPFRLMDLIGIDINAGAMRSMYEQTFGEPRYRPHWIQMQKLAERALGRKSGRGFYDYAEIPEEQALDIDPTIDQGSGQVLITSTAWAPGLDELCVQAGYETPAQISGKSAPVAAIVASGDLSEMKETVRSLDKELESDVPIFAQSANLPFSEILIGVQHPQRVIGFDGLFLNNGKLITLVSSETDEQIMHKAKDFWDTLGYRSEWIKESPALVLPRIICQLVNEAAFAYLEGVGDAETIDKAMRLGVNYPRGPLEWGKEVDYAKVLAVLDHLYAEYHEERYRACILLRRWARHEV
jgi:3-hydroxybutyryl-CoA dehydrogenase